MLGAALQAADAVRVEINKVLWTQCWLSHLLLKFASNGPKVCGVFRNLTRLHILHDYFDLLRREYSRGKHRYLSVHDVAKSEGLIHKSRR